MNLMIENSPETCLSLGLDCGTCIHQAAATVAKICRAVEPHGVQQIFFQLYPSPGCHPMAHAFELAFRESSNTLKTVVKFTSAAA
jgi:hypothetical protein